MPFGVEESVQIERVLTALNQSANVNTIILTVLVIVLFSLPFLWRFVMSREKRLSEAEHHEQKMEETQQAKIVDALVLVRSSLQNILEASQRFNQQIVTNHEATKRIIEVLDKVADIQSSILTAQREMVPTLVRVEKGVQGVSQQQRTFEDLLKLLREEVSNLVEIVIYVRDGSLDKDVVMSALNAVRVGVDTIAGDVHHIRSIVDTKEMEALNLGAPSDDLIHEKRKQLNDGNNSI